MITEIRTFDWKKWKFTVGMYLLMSIAFVVQRAIVDLQQGKPEEILNSLIDLIGFTGIWILFTFPITWITSRWNLALRTVIALFILGVLFSFAHAAIYLLHTILLLPDSFLATPIANVTDFIRTFAGLSHAWRFLSFGFLVVLSYAYNYYHLSIERERRAVELQAQLSESKLHVLKMQLHPHFLFNTLNAITVLIDENPAAAKETLRHLSDLLRLALENIQTQEVPLRREIEFLDKYLLIQKTRYEDRLTIEKHFEPETIDASVPYLILQPVVENALRHGIDAQPGPGTITISAKRQNGSLILQVDDTGPGFRNEKHPAGRGLGLANTQARLAQLYGVRQALTIEENSDGHGTSVIMKLPYNFQLPSSSNGVGTDG